MILYIILLLLSLSGYTLFLSRKTKIEAEFIPILTVSCSIALLFIAGLLNILPYAAWTILLCGIAALADSLRKPGRAAAFQKLITPGFVLFLLLICVFAVLFRDARLVHYDNFSHWGVIVKQMTEDDRLPNFTNASYIRFPSYPPGSGLFLYYISSFLGYHENIVIFVQAVMTTAAAMPMFAFLPKVDPEKKRASVFKILCTFLSMSGTLLLVLCCNVDIYSLLVDALLPAVAGGMACIALYYREQPAKAALLTLPISVATLLIKNTGIYFVLIQFVLLLCLWIRGRKRIDNKKACPAVLSHAVIPAFTHLLWSRHVAYVFEEASSSKHAMSAEHYSDVFSAKSIEDVQTIIQSFQHRIFDFSENSSLKVLLIMNVALLFALVFHVLFVKKHVGLLTTTLLAIDGIYAVYAGGLLAMYLLSMPTEEALYLASFDRYIYTILLYLLVPFVLCMTYIFIENSGPLQETVLGCLLLASISITIFTQKEFIRTNTTSTYLGSRVAQIDTAIAGWDDLNSAVVYCPTAARDGSYTGYCMQYKLLSSEFSFLYSVPTTADLQKQLAQYKYFMVLDMDEAIIAFLKDLGIPNPGPGIYTAQELQLS